MANRPVRRGQIWWVDWNPHRGSEQSGRRPALVIQSNDANELDGYNLTVVCAMSHQGHSDNLLHVTVDPSSLNGLDGPGYVRCEQIMTITKDRLDGYVGVLEPRHMTRVEQNIKDVLDLA